MKKRYLCFISMLVLGIAICGTACGDQSSGSADSLSSVRSGSTSSQSSQASTAGNQTENEPSGLYGRWELWVPGGYASTSSTTNPDGSRSVTQTYTPGAAADWIEIHEDGTFTWLDLGKTYKGEWSGDSDGVIQIPGGPLDFDWNMRLENGTEAKLYAWGLEYKATRSTGSKK